MTLRQLYTNVWLLFIINILMKIVDVTTTAVIIDIVGGSYGEANPFMKYVMDELSISSALIISFALQVIFNLFFIWVIKSDITKREKKWAWFGLYISTIVITIVAINNVIVLIRYMSFSF